MPSDGGLGEAHVLSQAIVELGRMLGLEMVAEGIETQQQADWFETLGCRFAQGYLYAHPMTPADLDKYLRRQLGRPRHSQSMRRKIQTAPADPRTVASTTT